MSSEPNLFDNTELTVLGELERRLNERFKHYGFVYGSVYKKVLIEVQEEIDILKPTEIEKLKLAFAEGGEIPQSAESWVRKFRQ